MTAQVQAFPFTFDRTTGAKRLTFTSAAAARRYVDRMGRMDGRDARAAKIIGADRHVMPSFPKPRTQGADGRFI